ncbi:TonB family protein [Agaribacterium haliotis]|uniref:TonB family protein n=1 Tax=Agaribacterium haliotis TaxID=2013869 RepID=UPI00130425C6|nr:TonB family protein [Agaribacterium haliotis]
MNRLLLIVFSLLAGSAHAAMLNGLSTYQNLGKDQFIAALYTDAPVSEPSSLLSSDAAARMEMRIVAPRITQRRFMSRLIENLTVNSEAAALNAQVEALGNLGKSLKSSLKTGDRLVVDYRPAEGTVIKLNGTELLSLRSDEFFRLLLATWVGDVPLSSDFRAAMLAAGNVDEVLLARYQGVAPSDARKSAVAAWQQPAVESVVEAQTAAPAKAASASASSAAAAKPVAKLASSSTSALAAKVESSDAAVKAKPVVSAPPSSVETKAQPAKTAAPAAATATSAEKIDQLYTADDSKSPTQEAVAAQSEADTQLAEAKPAEPAPVQSAELEAEQDADDDVALVLDERTIKLRQDYYRSLTEQVLKYQTLPRQAFQRRIEGEVRLEVSIDRSGYITDVKITKESAHTMFNKQALKAVEKASPFPAIPEGIVGREFSFSVPLAYELPY